MMRELGDLIFGRANHSLWIGSYDKLRTLVVKETVQTCEPEGQPQTILGVTEDLEDIRHLFARAMIGRIETIKRQVIRPAVLH